MLYTNARVVYILFIRSFWVIRLSLRRREINTGILVLYPMDYSYEIRNLVHTIINAHVEWRLSYELQKLEFTGLQQCHYSYVPVS